MRNILYMKGLVFVIIVLFILASIPSSGFEISDNKEDRNIEKITDKNGRGDIFPSVNIIKPKKGYLYIFDREILPTFRNNTIIIGKITIEMEFVEGDEIDEIEFYIDDILMHTDTQLTSWSWRETTIGWHTLRVTVHDCDGYIYSNETNIFIFNIGSSISPQPQVIQPLTETYVDEVVFIEAEELTGVGGVEHCLFEYSIDQENWIEINDDTNNNDGWTAEWDTNDIDNWFYTIKTTMYDTNGITGVDRIRVYVNNGAPLPYVSVVEYNIETGYVVFDGSESVDPDGYVEDWTWSFGDGNMGYGPIVEHIYNISEYPGLSLVELKIRDNDYAISYARNMFDKNEGVLFSVTDEKLIDNDYEKVTGDGFEGYVEFDDTWDDEYDYYVHNSNNNQKIHDVEIQTKYTGNTGDIKVSGMGFGWKVEKSKNKNGEVIIRVLSGITSKKKCTWLNIHLEIDFDNSANDAPPTVGRIRVSWDNGGTSKWVNINVPGNPP